MEEKLRAVGDPVKSPSHYIGEIETIDFIRDRLGPDGFRAYCRGNVLKYVSRYVGKNGVEDLEKAAEYLRRLTEAERDSM